MENRDKDKSYKLIPQQGTGQTHREVSLDVLKSAYIADGLGISEIAERYHLSESQVERIVEEHKLPELRKEYIKDGLKKIRNTQLNQAQNLLDLELNFKKMRLVQLQKMLEDFMAYYARHGDFCKRHPNTGDILKDTDGIPMQIYLPSVTKEIQAIKETVTLSEGLNNLLSQLDDVINGKPKGEMIDSNVIDMKEIDGLFKKST